MKRLAIASSAIVVLALSYAVISAEAPNRPAGVAANEWVAVSDSLGIVLVKESDRQARAMSPGALLLKPPVGGYFMVKGASGWTRLILSEPIKGPADAG